MADGAAQQTGLVQNPAGNRGWVVTFAGTGINLALGILYAWSVFKAAIATDFGWQEERLNDPYALCCLVFAFAMILAGRCQDKLGPRVTAFIGGLLVSAGLLWVSTTTSYTVWVLGSASWWVPASGSATRPPRRRR